MHDEHHAHHTHDELALQIEDLRYALSRHVPAMQRQVRIQTGYGAVEFYGTQARQIAALCDALLRRRLQRIERQGALPR